MKDRRNFPRSIVDLILCARIGDKWIDGKILDLTVGGISMELDRELQTGTCVTIDIKQCQEVKKNELRVEVTRCVPTEADPSRYRLAARFIEPNDEFLMDVLALVHEKNPKRDRRSSIYGKR